MWLVVTDVRSKSFGLVTHRRHDIGVLCVISHICAYWGSLTVMHVIFFIVECGITRFLCAMCALCWYSTFGQHPHLVGYLCAKFHFVHCPYCWANPWRKITYSITHSPSLFDALGTEAKVRTWTSQIDRQTHRQTDRQTDGQTHIRRDREHYLVHSWTVKTEWNWREHSNNNKTTNKTCLLHGEPVPYLPIKSITHNEWLIPSMFA